MPKCKVESCDRPSTAQGFCGKHYKNYIRTGNPVGRTRLVEKGSSQRHPLYQTWLGMRARCLSPSNKSFDDYGGRGIELCESWQKDFWEFVVDIGPRPSGKHSIDRIDVDGNYEPGNVRWATPKQQNWNKRSTRLTEEQREFLLALVPGKSVRSVCLENNIDYDAALRFLDGRNYSPDIVDHAVSSPAKKEDLAYIAYKPAHTKKCSIDGCGEHLYAKTFCKLHYRRQYESKSLAGQEVDTKRFCQNCDKQLPDHFRPQTLYCDRACTLQFHRREGCYTQEAQLASRGACTVDGCGKPQHAQNVCRTHYMKAWHAQQKAKENPG